MLDLWARARYDFGLTDQEFLALVPVEFFALCRRQETENDTHRIMVAQLRHASFASTSLRDDKKPWKLSHFLPEYLAKKVEAQEASLVMSNEQLLAIAEGLNRSLGGKDRRKKKKKEQ